VISKPVWAAKRGPVSKNKTLVPLSHSIFPGLSLGHTFSLFKQFETKLDVNAFKDILTNSAGFRIVLLQPENFE
jgi:hypothetical protein